MTRFKPRSMWLSPSILRNSFCCAAVIAVAGLVGCGDSCFVAFSNNGKGGVVIKAGNLPPSCSLTKANGSIRVVAVKSPVCETCTAAARVEHLLLAVRRVELRSDPNSVAWLEMEPAVASVPRQIDFISRDAPEILIENAIVPAGTYREVRLELFDESRSNSETPPPENACGGSRWNCIVMADGRIEPLRFSDDVPKVQINIENAEGDSFTLLPDSSVDLQLRLEARQILYSSSTEALKAQNIVVGHGAVVRH